MWNLSKYGENIAAIDESGAQYTYDWLDTQSQNLIEHVKPDRCLVFNLCTNTIGSLLGYVCFINNQITPLLLDSHLDNDLLVNLIETYQPEYLWVPNTMVADLNECTIVYSAQDYTLLKTSYDSAYALHEELALLLTTSGSTGSPKLVRQSYKNIESNTRAIVEYLQIDETERPITTLPMSYTYGLSIINSHLYAGASIILTDKALMQKEFWQQFKANEATSFGGVPYTYQMLDKLRFSRMDLPSLRTMTQAGGKLAPELHKKFAQYSIDNNKQFYIMYGQTEATARMGYLPHEMALEKFGSMGRAIPGGKLILIDVNGSTITQADTTGELVYEGDNVTLGYAECGDDLALGDQRHGRLVTGDMAKYDSDGYLYIVGRKKRFLKIFGSRINLDETERMIKREFPELDCACTGQDDAMYAFVTDISRKDEVLDFLTTKTGFNHIAFHIKQIDEVPKNEAGKVLYKALNDYMD